MSNFHGKWGYRYRLFQFCKLLVWSLFQQSFNGALPLSYMNHCRYLYLSYMSSFGKDKLLYAMRSLYCINVPSIQEQSHTWPYKTRNPEAQIWAIERTIVLLDAPGSRACWAVLRKDFNYLKILQLQQFTLLRKHWWYEEQSLLSINYSTTASQLLGQ